MGERVEMLVWVCVRDSGSGETVGRDGKRETMGRDHGKRDHGKYNGKDNGDVWL